MLSEPCCEVSAVILAILIENDDDGSDFACQPVGLAHKNLLATPIPDRLANIDAVEDRRGEWLDANAFFGQQRLSLFLEESTVVFNDQVLGGIGANRLTGRLLRPFAREFFPLAGLDSGGLQALLCA